MGRVRDRSTESIQEIFVALRTVAWGKREERSGCVATSRETAAVQCSWCAAVMMLILRTPADIPPLSLFCWLYFTTCIDGATPCRVYCCLFNNDPYYHDPDG